MTSSANIHFTKATRYLESVAIHDRAKIQDELEKLKNYADELNPTSEMKDTMSAHRKLQLESRIEELFKTIESKLSPIVLNPIEISKQQKTSLGEFKEKCLSLPPKQLHAELKKLPFDVKKRIYEIVWIASGCPKELQFSERLLKRDTSIFQKQFPSLIGNGSGTLLEQVEADLTLNFELTEQVKVINGLNDVAGDLSANRPAEEIKRKFQALPQEVQQAVFEQAVAAGFRGSISEARDAILADMSLLKGIKNLGGGVLAGNNIIEQCAAAAGQHLKAMFDGKVRFFQDRFSEIANTHLQMRALFNFMHTSVQDHLRSIGIQPPFYGRGINTELYRTLGSHYDRHSGRTTFRVYAPNASKIVLNLTAFGYTQHAINMVKGEDGVWTAQTDKAPPGRSYHLMVTGKGSSDPVKRVDPFAFRNLIHNPDAGRNNHESMVYDADQDYKWSDGAWIAARDHARRDISKEPFTIYEVHSTTWMHTDDGKPLSWRELAPKLADYCKTNGYNAVELMAIFAHPQHVSMGYQITNFFAPNNEMGTWEDFQYFVDYMHNVDLGSGRKGINVFADWVPAHFALDEFALSNFDGTQIFEDENPMYAWHPEWGTKIFDFKKQFTRDFLASSADFILRKLHVDGLRVDAVSSMLYLNYARERQLERSEYIKRYNMHGTEVDLDAKAFLRNLNVYIHKQFPGVLTMAEESSAFPNVTRSPFEKGEHGVKKSRGLGFDATWHFGFMNDSLAYWRKPASERSAAFPLFTSTIDKVDENSDKRPRGRVILPYSHDESAAAKGTIFTKMSGNTREQKFANGRLALAYQLLRGGGPILDFMGNETLQTQEWHGILKHHVELPTPKLVPTFQWEELDPSKDKFEYQYHRGAQASRGDLNHLYHSSPGLWDQTDKGFAWIDTDSTNCVLSFHRRGEGGQQFACIFNSSDQDMVEYLIPLPNASYAPELDRLTGVKEVYNTDDANYGGQGRTNASVEIVRDASTKRPTHFKLRLPPFTAIVLEEQFA